MSYHRLDAGNSYGNLTLVEDAGLLDFGNVHDLQDVYAIVSQALQSIATEQTGDRMKAVSSLVVIPGPAIQTVMAEYLLSNGFSQKYKDKDHPYYEKRITKQKVA